SHSPLRSPVNVRPVRLPPWAAGASPTTSTRARGSPKPGTGRPQYVQSRNAARFVRATASRYRTSRGHLRHAMISEVSRSRPSEPIGLPIQIGGKRVASRKPRRPATPAVRRGGALAACRPTSPSWPTRGPAATHGRILPSHLTAARRAAPNPVRHGDAILLRTGWWERRRRTSAYLSENPGLTGAGARLLVEWGAGIVGIDTANVDRPNDATYP